MNIENYDFNKLYDKLFSEDYVENIKIIVGHLIIEIQLRELLSKGCPDFCTKGSYGTLLNKCHKNNLINEEQKDTLSKINNVRNKIAHEIFYKLKSEDLLEIATQTESAFNELKTSLAGSVAGWIDPQKDDIKDVSWAIPQIFSQIMHELTYIKLNVDPSAD